MNKGELVDAIATKASVSKKTADATLTSVLEAIIEAVAAGDKVSLVPLSLDNARLVKVVTLKLETR